MRNVLAHVKQGRKDMVASYMRTAMAEETLEETQARWDEVAANMQEHHPKVAAMMRESRDEVLAHRHFPSGLWSILASTNTLERLNGEVKRRTDVVQIFPNRASALMLVGALLMEQHDEWQVARKTTTKSLLQNAHTKGDALLARAGGKK
jgi:transposase-like protein